MSIYRIECRQGGKAIIGHGTAWQLEENLCVTAFHVVGNQAEDKWLHEVDQTITYHLVGGGEASNYPLQPFAQDTKADIAVLRSAKPLPLTPLVLSESVVEDARWRADGFPTITGDEAFRLTGTVVAVRSRGAADDLQLTVDQGTFGSWKGASGSAICVEGRVVGILTQEVDKIETLRAARIAPLLSILQRIKDKRPSRAVGYLLRGLLLLVFATVGFLFVNSWFRSSSCLYFLPDEAALYDIPNEREEDTSFWFHAVLTGPDGFQKKVPHYLGQPIVIDFDSAQLHAPSLVKDIAAQLEDGMAKDRIQEHLKNVAERGKTLVFMFSRPLRSTDSFTIELHRGTEPGRTNYRPIQVTLTESDVRKPIIVCVLSVKKEHEE